jgi:hypothetical protein
MDLIIIIIIIFFFFLTNKCTKKGQRPKRFSVIKIKHKLRRIALGTFKFHASEMFFFQSLLVCLGSGTMLVLQTLML